MAKVEIYTSPLCGFCHAAKRLLTQKGVSFAETNVATDRDLKAAMVQRAGGRTSVPQIFINDFHVGGCDDLFELESGGQLDKMLAA